MDGTGCCGVDGVSGVSFRLLEDMEWRDGEGGGE